MTDSLDPVDVFARELLIDSAPVVVSVGGRWRSRRTGRILVVDGVDRLSRQVWIHDCARPQIRGQIRWRVLLDRYERLSDDGPLEAA